MSVPNKKASKGLKCYFCDGPHLIRGCTEKNPLAAIVKAMDESTGVVAKLGAKVIMRAAESSGSRGATTSAKVVKPGRSQGKTAKEKAVKPKAEQLKCYRCKGPHKLRKCPNRVKPSKEDKLEGSSQAAKLGSMKLSSAKASDQAYNGLLMFGKANKVLAEDVRRENIAFETPIVDESKGAGPGSEDGELAEDVRRENMPLETTTIVEVSKEAKPEEDIATMETSPMGKVREKSRISSKKSRRKKKHLTSRKKGRCEERAPNFKSEGRVQQLAKNITDDGSMPGVLV
ncbi:hypothetical protein V6N13_001009 [Hibiscus sabdariffa]